MVEAEAIGLLAIDQPLQRALREAVGRIPARSRRRFVLRGTNGRRGPSKELARLLFFSWASDLSAELHASGAGLVRGWEGYLVFVRSGTPSEALSSLARLRVQDPSRLQFVTAADLEQACAHIHAFVGRLSHRGASEGILHAWWVADSLEILTTVFRRISVPRSLLAPLVGVPAGSCRQLEIGYDGTWLAWPAMDVHLGFEQLVSPDLALRKRQESQAFSERYGAAIRTVRRTRGLKQSSIGGLTPRHVGRIERGQARATCKALGKLAQAHGLSEAQYLAEIATALESAD
jgi:hypothetical protein